MSANCKDEEAYIELNDVTFAYAEGKTVLNDISVFFYRGEFTAIVGPNGSGKTTLSKLMAGILTADSGEVVVDGTAIADFSLGTIGQKIGYLFQQPERQLFNPTVREEIGFVPSFLNQSEEEVEKKVKQMIEEFSLAGLETASPYRISRGERQRVALAAVLINEPSFLVLDEPTTGLDSKRKENLSQLLQKLKEQGIGIAVSSHEQDFVAENAERVVEVGGGELNET
mgnify:CR=1 FL=1